MNKAVLLAKVRRWKAELIETIETLNGEGKRGPILEVLNRRCEEMDKLIAAIEEYSFIPDETEQFEPEPMMEEIADKVKKVKEGVKKIHKLSDEKTKIIEKLSQDD